MFHFIVGQRIFLFLPPLHRHHHSTINRSSDSGTFFVTDFCAQSYEFHADFSLRARSSTTQHRYVPQSSHHHHHHPIPSHPIQQQQHHPKPRRLFIAIQSIAGILKIDIACKRSSTIVVVVASSFSSSLRGAID